MSTEGLLKAEQHPPSALWDFEEGGEEQVVDYYMNVTAVQHP